MFCRPASAELLFGYENNLSALTGTSDQRGSLWERVIKQSQVTISHQTDNLSLPLCLPSARTFACRGPTARGRCRRRCRGSSACRATWRTTWWPGWPWPAPAAGPPSGSGVGTRGHVFTSPFTCVFAGTRSGGSLFIQPDFDIEESHALDDMKRDYFRFVDIEVVLNFSKCSITEATTCVCWKTWRACRSCLSWRKVSAPCWSCTVWTPTRRWGTRTTTTFPAWRAAAGWRPSGLLCRQPAIWPSLCPRYFKVLHLSLWVNVFHVY